ncbi:MAG TPA: flagellar filament capping protein FliD [Planctomycetota bacterium]|nr:flagellar filament capping protein FliD [Planctomycetota bacterium]
MSSAGISFGGLASGLDTKAIISALVAIEQRPITALETKKTSLGKQKSLFGDLKGLLEKLTTAAKAIQGTTNFLSYKAASDDENVLTASASNSAVPGTYTVRVLDLAKAQVNSSSGSASPTASLGVSGELQLDVGGVGHPISVANPTLESIAAAINAENDTLGFGVRAEVVDTGNLASGGANRYQLVVRSTTTGSTGGFSLTATEGDPAFANLIDDVNTNVRTIGSDARIELNGGITVYRSSNSIGDVIPGVTIDLKSVPVPPKDITITVGTDTEATSKKVTEFVDAYNKVVDFFATQNALDADGKAKGPLFGDVTLRSIRSNVRSIVGGSVAGTGNQAYQLFAQIGITSDRDGKLTFNQSKFEEALADDEHAVAAVFTDPTGGIAGRLVTQLDLYTDSVDGLIKTRSDGYDRQVKQTQDRIDQSQRRLEAYQKQLEAKYANLESLLSKLQSQGSSLSSFGK